MFILLEYVLDAGCKNQPDSVTIRNMNIVIRDYTEADHERMKEMMAELVMHMHTLDSFKRFRTYDDLDSEKYIKNKLENLEAEKGKMIVAELDGKLVGYLTATMGDSAGTDDEINKYPFKQGNIDDVFIEDGHRGQGIVNKLITAIEQYFKDNGCHYSNVPCLATNEAARKAYSKNGYTEQYIDFLKRL